MPKKRQDKVPEPTLPIWEKDGKLYYTTREKLEKAIVDNGVPMEQILKNLGASQHYLEEAYAGKRFSGYSMSFIEYAIKPTPIDTVNRTYMIFR